MNVIALNFQVTVDESNVRTFVNLIREALHVDTVVDPNAEARMRASRNAIYAGQKPPEDRGLLIDTKQVAKLLKVSARTIYKMEHDGEMPKAIRIGKAVRWGHDEIKQWVTAGCPPADQWTKLWRQNVKGEG